MIRYRLVDGDGDTHDLPDSFQREDDKGEVEVELIERSGQPGADFPGDQRDKSKEISFKFAYHNESETAFRAYLNNILYWFRKAVKIQDLINNIETEIIFNSPSITYEDGCVNHVADVTLECKMPIPYWWDISETTINISVDTGNTTYTINNTGSIDLPVELYIDNLNGTPIDDFTIRVLETTSGINVQDDQFGVGGLDIYLIDNEEGTCEIWDGILTPVDRKHKIYAGTGFFRLPVGESTLEFVNLEHCGITVTYKKRYYI